jgi:hypothetical protein
MRELRMRLFVLIALFVLLLVGCGGSSERKGTNATSMDSLTTRFVDREFGVVCYRATGGGISCLKLDKNGDSP